MYDHKVNKIYKEKDLDAVIDNIIQAKYPKDNPHAEEIREMSKKGMEKLFEKHVDIIYSHIKEVAKEQGVCECIIEVSEKDGFQFPLSEDYFKKIFPYFEEREFDVCIIGQKNNSFESKFNPIKILKISWHEN